MTNDECQMTKEGPLSNCGLGRKALPFGFWYCGLFRSSDFGHRILSPWGRQQFPKAVVVLLGLMLAPAAIAQSAARQAGYLYLSPVPNAPYVSAQTRYILVRFDQVAPGQVTNLTTGFIQVTGAASGTHAGSTHVASDGRTVIYEMGTDFYANELVTVALNPQITPGNAGALTPYQYQFMVMGPMPGASTMARRPAKPVAVAQAPVKVPNLVGPTNGVAPAQDPAPKAVLMSNGVAVPGDFPRVVITVNSNPSPGYLFLENGLESVPRYTMILDNNGLPVWYRRGRMYDFKIQKNGMITWTVTDGTGFEAFDQNFNHLKTYATTNGYLTDSHDLKIQLDDTYFMLGYRYNPVDLSRYIIGGNSNAIVKETVIQEFTPHGELIFQWRAWDNYDIADGNGNSDFPHMNAIDIDEDGNILVSSRHLSEVTKINRDSGEIIWRLSGARSTFSFVDDPFNGMSLQHDITCLGNGHYMVFDNGNYHTPQVSRAVEYALDLTNAIARMVWQFRNTPDVYTYWLGSAQRLPSGNTLIDFVTPQSPKAIEVDTNGAKHFELSLVPNSDSYRAFRLPWTALVTAPYLVLEPQLDNITLIFNKFGDTNVAYYRIYGGPAPHPTTLVAESTTTLKQVFNLPNGLFYFRVTAVSQSGSESPFSNEENINLNITPPGGNLVQNGDFSQGKVSWRTNISGGAIVGWSVTNGLSQCFITNGGTSLANVQLSQLPTTLVQGKLYILEFDAWASRSRYIEVKLAQISAPFNDYSQISPPYLTPNRTHYHFVFKMQQPSDFYASLQFNLGAATGEVYIDNVNLFTPAVGDLSLDGRVDFADLKVWTSDWLQQQPALPGDLNGDGTVNFNDFGILGANWSSGASGP
ncbi:MAG TPA: aryl-sulfate sulfotransferase [Candidatus Limnocylindrales bacterium]|nr:aryl-sulfate sulfotransferase [Candidatus Limnocylindrales bacterium]